MKFLFVSRKKYETTKRNYRKSVEHRQELQRRYIELQKEHVELQKEVKEVKSLLEKDKNQETLKKCTRCNTYFTVPKTSRRKICINCKTKKKGGK